MAKIIDESISTEHLTQDPDLDDLWYDDDELRRWTKSKFSRLYFRRGVLEDKDEYIAITNTNRGGLSCTTSSLDVDLIISLADECEYRVVSRHSDNIAVRRLDDIDPEEYHQTTPPQGQRDPRERGDLS